MPLAYGQYMMGTKRMSEGKAENVSTPVPTSPRLRTALGRATTMNDVIRKRSMAGSKARFIKKDREAVASTVGTIMALLVFLAFLSLFTNSYMPVWMEDNEREHMNEVMNQFGEMKSRVDSLVLNSELAGGTMNSVYVPLTLGSSGIPVFASPTAGQLAYVPQTSSESGTSLTFNSTIGDGIVEEGGGMLEFYAPNRYYVQQWVTYENGALIMKQDDGQVVRAYPNLNIQKAGNEYALSFTQVDLIGVNTTRGGTGSMGVNIEMIYMESQEYTISDGIIMWDMHTLNRDAWVGFLEETFGDHGLVEGTHYEQPWEDPADESHLVVKLMNVSTMDYARAVVSMSLEM
jgi:hypothetical protein